MPKFPLSAEAKTAISAATLTGAIAGTDAAAITLSMLAAAGGTTMATTVMDSAALQQQVSDILTGIMQPSLVSCALEFDKAVANDAELHLVVTRNGTPYDVDLGGDAGWKLSSDRTRVELTGALCSAAQHGLYTKVKLELGCVRLESLPAP